MIMAVRRALAVGLAGAACVAASPAAPPRADLQVTLEGLRSTRGVVHVCLTHQAARFLQCQADRQAIGLTLPAAKAAHFALPRVAPGTYALLVVHDENANGKLDMTFKIPREGFGFSNNPAIHMRPPRFDEVRFQLAPGKSKQAVRVRYVL